MTECERIVQKGIIPNTYFKAETLCDYYVDEKKKKIWAVELDLLIEFDQLCKNHNLTYFLSVGTLLGSIRHQGFIPWDDDVDVEMPREDYEKFQSICNGLQFPYFLQTPYTDPYYGFSHIRFMNVNTTCFSTTFAFQPMKHGIYLDIFPLDSWDEKDETINGLIDSLNRENSTYMRLLNPHVNKNDKKRIETYKGIDHIQVYEEIQRLAQKNNSSDSPYFIRAVRSCYDFKKYHFFKSDYSVSINGFFENYTFPIPIGYERILQTQFGNYYQFPPVEERGEKHNNFVFEPDIPYNEFLSLYIKMS